ncbi:transcriptional regulator [Longibacter salinarum]|uniref:Transcriptional regulator n=1 Tax=Longibacter salinarum TaxID=1850348 RepID=A0A2A8D274_9BACT|nr:Rrf2 family transcriptional regulator [Longibacter salinarum]PEN14984.1 transcriptional regulator [Longibacter salinarum]
MLLSKGCEYGLAGAMYLASIPQKGYVPIRAISEHLDISYPFLTKVLQQLNEAGLLTSMRGPNGGVALSQAPERLTLKEIVIAIDGPELFTECVLGLPGCGHEKPCPLHDQWGEVRDHLDGLFGGLSLAEAVGREADIMEGLDFPCRGRRASPGR